ncbi:hypothetical protein ACJD0Z_14710 [Flavobacteriaceae bacterium M23B6Z8]
MMAPYMRQISSILSLLVLMLTACQNEVDVVSPEPGAPGERIEVGSSTAQAIVQVGRLDGSLDNIIDGASCLSIVYPVTVTANSVTVEVLSVNDMAVIEGIFDADIEDEDILEIAYPITVINDAHQVITVANDAELETLGNNCVEGGLDNDNECIDFVYPLTFFIFNTVSEITNQVQIRNDRDLFVFMNGVSVEEVISLDYPVSLISHEGADIAVNSNQQLTTAIIGAEEDCDEDDDNNFNDDDFADGELEALLTECIWRISRFKRNGTPQAFVSWTVEFRTDGSITILNPSQIIGIDGTWSTRFTEEGSFVDLDMGDVVEFTLQWNVNKVDQNTIYIFSSTGSYIELEKECEGAQTSGNIIREKVWSIGVLDTPNPQDESDYIGIPLDFKELGVASLRVNGVEEEGEWQLIANENKEILRITFPGRPSLSQAWDVEILEENEIRLVKGMDKRLTINKIDENEANTDLQNVQSLLKTQNWSVKSYQVNGSDETSIFDNYTFSFADNGLVQANDGNANTNGSWLSYVSNPQVIVELNFGNTSPVENINARWRVTSVSAIEITLESTGSGNPKTLVLENI